MKLKSSNNNPQSINTNSEVVNNVNSTLDQITTILNFEELRKEHSIQGIKENLGSILVCIRGIKNELAKLHIESNDIDYYSVHKLVAIL